jgi:nucleoid-associated protein YgaU
MTHQARKHPAKKHPSWLWLLIGPVLIGIVAAPFLLLLGGNPSPSNSKTPATHSASAQPTPPKPTAQPTPVKPKLPVQQPGHHHHHVVHVQHIAKTASTYTVKTGDTLWAISAHVYHTPLSWSHLYQLNKSVIGSNPNIIHTGEVLHL